MGCGSLLAEPNSVSSKRCSHPKVFRALLTQFWRVSDAFWNVPLFPTKQDPFWRIFDAFLMHSCYCRRLFWKHLLDDTDKLEPPFGNHRLQTLPRKHAHINALHILHWHTKVFAHNLRLPSSQSQNDSLRWSDAYLGVFQRPLTQYFCKSIAIQMGGVSRYKLVVYILLSSKKRAYFCKSIAIEMGGASRYFSKVSGSGVDSALLTYSKTMATSVLRTVHRCTWMATLKILWGYLHLAGLFHFGFILKLPSNSSGAWRGGPDGIATLKVRNSAFEALNKRSGALEKWSKVVARSGEPPEELYDKHVLQN